MSMQAIDVSPEIAAAFKEMQDSRTYAYTTIKLDGKAAVVDQKVKLAEANNDPWGHLLASLIIEEPRFILFNAAGTNVDGHGCVYCVFIIWCSDDAGIWAKMAYAAAKDQVKNSLEGLSYNMQLREVPKRPSVLDIIVNCVYTAFYGKTVWKTASGYVYA